MKALHKGLILAVLHLLLVSTLAGKLLIDRAKLPRVWVLTAPYDPDLPIRGRYVRLGLVVPTRGLFPETIDSEHPWEGSSARSATLVVEGEEVIAVASDGEDGIWVRRRDGSADPMGILDRPVAFFIPEHVSDPSRRPEGEELWAEVTLPMKGPPRPIRLGVKKNGVLTPLTLE